MLGERGVGIEPAGKLTNCQVVSKAGQHFHDEFNLFFLKNDPRQSRKDILKTYDWQKIKKYIVSTPNIDQP